MKTFVISYRVTSKGQLVDESIIFRITKTPEEAEIQAYELLDKEYEGIGRVKIQDIRGIGQ